MPIQLNLTGLIDDIGNLKGLSMSSYMYMYASYMYDSCPFAHAVFMRTVNFDRL